MDLQTESQSVETLSPSEPAPEGQSAQAASLPPGTPAPAPADKTIEQKIREKSVVTPSMDKPAVPVPPAFTPNFKFKAANKEHEIPEFLRGVIKDEQSQKFIHQLFEKAYGIETVKGRLEAVRQEHQQLNQAYGTVMQTVQLGREAYQRGDLDTVFQTFRIPEEKVLQWAIKKVQLSQMPPEQRHVHEARDQAERRAWELERMQRDQGQEQLQQQSQQLVEMLDIVLERPEYSSLAQEFEARKGPGAFRSLAIQMGEFEYHQSGKVLSPMEAAQRAADMLGGVQRQQPQQAAAPAPAQQATPATQQKIVLPNVGAGKPAAPAKAPPKSLDDIRKIYDQKMAAGR
jgi:hypothetical protein